MGTVKDLAGTEWRVVVNTSNLSRLKEDVKIDLLTILDDKDLVGRLFTDMELQRNVIKSLCTLQVAERNVGDVEWGDLWNGDSLDSAMSEVIECLAQYLPKSRGAVLRRGVEALMKYVQTAAAKATVMLEEVDVDKLAERQMAAAKRQLPNSAGD